jgi:hypothetical protein
VSDIEKIINLLEGKAESSQVDNLIRLVEQKLDK